MAPIADIIEGQDIAIKPYGGASMLTDTNCTCGCNTDATYPNTPVYPPYPPYPCPEPVVSPTSIGGQIAKMGKKAEVIKRMIDELTVKNKSMIITVNKTSYNFGTYLNAELEETAYGTAVLTILESELEAIKEKIVELTNELEETTETSSTIEGTVTQ